MTVKLSRYIFRRIGGRIIPIRQGKELVSNVKNFSMSALRKLQGKTNKDRLELISKFTKDSVVKIPVYHGSKAPDFKKFKYEKIGSQTGTGGAGRGFYFTPNKQMASHYGKVREFFLNIKKPILHDENSGFQSAKLTRREIHKIIGKADLSNFGDVAWEGRSKVKREAVEMMASHDDDLINQVNDIGVSVFHGDFKKTFERVTKFSGYDSIVKSRKGIVEIVATNPSQIMLSPEKSKIYKKELIRLKKLSNRGK